ncbi:hypothetical protein ACIBSV_06875 [Embleya sp. NPDC050154]|uniref:hypothetical protein n=1 Tax=Embleya sp. NPDC050154 TaxID=3363988 RepID=UPI0037B47261
MSEWATLLSRAPRRVMVPVLERCGAEIRRGVLGGAATPDPRVVDAVIAHGSPASRHLLAENPAVAPRTLRRLADHADGPLAWRLAVHPRIDRDLMVRVMAIADPGRAVLDSSPYDRTVAERYALVESVNPEHIVHGLRGLIVRGCPPTARSVAFRAAHNLLGALGPKAGRALFTRHGPLMDDADRDVVTRAFAHRDGPAILDRLSVFKARRQILVRRLHNLDVGLPDGHYYYAAYIHPSEMHLLLLSPRATLEWDEVLRADEARPWGPVGALTLADQPGCPDELRSRAEAVRFDVRTTGTPDADRAIGPWWHRVPPGARVTPRGSVPAAPPRSQALHSLGPATSDAYDRTLRALTDEFLADHVDAWVVALRMLPEFQGSMIELLETAGRSAGGPVSRTRRSQA